MSCHESLWPRFCSCMSSTCKGHDSIRHSWWSVHQLVLSCATCSKVDAPDGADPVPSVTLWVEAPHAPLICGSSWERNAYDWGRLCTGLTLCCVCAIFALLARYAVFMPVSSEQCASCNAWCLRHELPCDVLSVCSYTLYLVALHSLPQRAGGPSLGAFECVFPDSILSAVS